MRINVLVVPNSKESEVVKTDTVYKVRVDAPAVEGKANRRLIEILSNYFKVKKSSISIIKGLKSKNKMVEIDL